MPDKSINTFHEESQAVQTHLEMTQAVIRRMATNSLLSKGFCIGTTSIIPFLAVCNSKHDHVLVTIFPVLLFFILDAYYLALEKRFRNSYNDFIGKLHSSGIKSTEIYTIAPSGNFFKTIRSALLSFSVWPFYLMLAIVVIVSRLDIA